jgi:hypothetical protein
MAKGSGKEMRLWMTAVAPPTKRQLGFGCPVSPKPRRQGYATPVSKIGKKTWASLSVGDAGDTIVGCEQSQLPPSLARLYSRLRPREKRGPLHENSQHPAASGRVSARPRWRGHGRCLIRNGPNCPYRPKRLANPRTIGARSFLRRPGESPWRATSLSVLDTRRPPFDLSIAPSNCSSPSSEADSHAHSKALMCKWLSRFSSCLI